MGPPGLVGKARHGKRLPGEAMCPDASPRKRIFCYEFTQAADVWGPFLSLLPIDYKQDRGERVKDLHQMMEGVMLNGKLSIRIFGAVIR